MQRYRLLSITFICVVITNSPAIAMDGGVMSTPVVGQARRADVSFARMHQATKLSRAALLHDGVSGNPPESTRTKRRRHEWPPDRIRPAMGRMGRRRFVGNMLKFLHSRLVPPRNVLYFLHIDVLTVLHIASRS